MNSSVVEPIGITLAALGRLLEPTETTLGATERAALTLLATTRDATLNDVAGAASIAKSTASECISSLQSRGFVTHARQASDRRRLALRITPAGRRALSASPALDLTRLDAALATLPADTATGLAAGLQALAAALDPADGPSPSPGPAPAELRLLVVRLAGGDYALPLDQVREVLPYRRPRRLASPSAWLEGVLAVRGALLPVSDLRRRLGLDAASRPDALVVVQSAGGPVALAVDSVARLVTVGAATVGPPVGGGAGISGIVEAGGELLVLLEPDLLIAD